jgi:uncharacterized phage-associated protein
MLYVAQKSESDPKFGAVKLNKILFYSDFLAYLKLGRSITGEVYQRLERGPAPRRLLQVRRSLINNAEAALQKVDRYGHKQERLVALRDPDMSLFGGEEVALVEQVLDQCRPYNGSELSEMTHRFAGWMAAKEGETIPYSMALVSMRKATPQERDMAKALIKTLAA